MRKIRKPALIILFNFFVYEKFSCNQQFPAPSGFVSKIHNKSKAHFPDPKDFHAWMRKRFHRSSHTGKIISFHGRSGELETQVVPSSWVKVAARGLYLMLVFAPLIFLSGLAAISSTFRHNVWFPLAVRSMASCGAAFIKWGQWASTRPDVFPETLCQELAPLTHMAPTHSWRHTKAKVEHEIGCKLEEYFDSFDTEPCASGSVAQVYKATILGHLVAVKVTHPNVAEQISLDFQLMAWIAAIVDSIPGLGWLNLKASMNQFSHTMAGQARLDVEAEHLDVFNCNFRRWKDTHFPVPLFRSHDVLIETFEEGILVSHFSVMYRKYLLNQTKHPCSVVRGGSHFPLASFVDAKLAHYIVTRGEDIYLKMLLVDNLMHADLHPGNILVRSSIQNRDRKSSLCLLDAGMVAQLTEIEQQTFVGFLSSLSSGDGAKTAGYILKFSESQTCSLEQQEEFARCIKRLFEEKCRGYGTGTQLGEVFRGVLTLIREHQVRIDANYATLILNALCLDGLAQELEPEYNIVDGAASLLRAHWLLYSKPGRLLFRLFLPIGQALKRRQDRKFWRRLQKSKKVV